MLSPVGLLNLFSRPSPRSHQLAAGLDYGCEPRQQLDVYAPKTQSGPLPVLVFFYGGSWSMGERQEYRFAGRFLASLGYLTVVPDYRLVPKISYPAFLSDSAAAVRWAAANAAAYGGDGERIVVMGHSAGAYNAVMAALDPGLGVQALISACVGLSGPYDFYPFDVGVAKRAFAGVADPERTQPVNLVTSDAPPMFLATGELDRSVQPRNTVALARRLRDAGVEVIERHYAGVKHAGPLLELGSVLGGRFRMIEDVQAFLAPHLGEATRPPR